MNLYKIKFETNTFSIETTCESKNMNESRRIGVLILKMNNLVPNFIKEKINEQTIKVDRIYKNKRRK